MSEVVVGIYAGPGAIDSCVLELETLLEACGCACRQLGPADVRAGLGGIDLIAFPGGGGQRMGRALGPSGRQVAC